MASTYNEGLKPVLDHLDVKNRESVSAWEERLWQRQLTRKAVDPRDEQGRTFFRKHVATLSELRRTAEKLHKRKRRTPITSKRPSRARARA